MTTEIDVVFQDADTGRELVRRRLPPGALPERLGPPRRLELKSRSFAVVSAEPPTNERAAAKGSLVVRLRALPEGVFTVPTLVDELPRFDETAPREGRLLELPEDDWRQLEVVSVQQLPRVEEQLERIGAVRKEIREDGLFPRMHVRTQLGPPLKGATVSLSDVEAALPPGYGTAAGVVLEGGPGRVKDGFAYLTMSGLELYGVAPKGQVKLLCVRPPAEPVDLGVEATGLAALFARHQLRLVDWVSGRVAGVDPDELVPLLLG